MRSDSREWIEDICIGLLLTTICILGILGNIVTFLVLCYQHYKTRRVIIVFFLLGLCIFDTLFLLTWLTYGLRYAHRLFGYGLPSKVFSTKVSAYYSLIAQPFGYIGNVGSNILIVAITIDRYLSVCRTCMIKRFYESRKTVCISVSIVIFVMALPLAIPSWMANEVIPAKDGGGYVVNRMEDSFGASSEVTHFKHWYNSIITMIIPFPILIILNALIFRKVHKANQARKMLTESEVSEISLAKMLLCVVLVYGICNMPVIVKAIVVSVSNVKFIRPSKTGELEKYTSQTIFRIIHWLCIVLNASVNFLIYCIMSRAFRKALIDLCKFLWAKMQGRNYPKPNFSAFRSTLRNPAVVSGSGGGETTAVGSSSGGGEQV